MKTNIRDSEDYNIQKEKYSIHVDSNLVSFIKVTSIEDCFRVIEIACPNREMKQLKLKSLDRDFILEVEVGNEYTLSAKISPALKNVKDDDFRTEGRELIIEMTTYPGVREKKFLVIGLK